MTQKPKRKLKNIDFSDDMSHIALVSKHQGGPANGADYSLVLKNLNNPSPEFIQKMQAIQVTMTIPDFLERFFMLWEEDVEFLSQLLGYVEPPEDEQAEAIDDYNKWIEERFQSFSIIKSLHEAKNLPDALSKLTEQDYLDVLTDQAVIEKALTEFTKGAKPEANTSTKVESKVEASASSKKKKEKQMTQETEMVEKSALTAIEKALEDQKIALEKALAQVKQYEDEKKEAIVKSKTDAVKAVVKDEKQAAVVVKAALALEDQADFDALVEVFKSMNDLLEKSGLFQEQGVSAEAAEDKPGETKLMKALKARHQAKQ
jgi:hypothetical protein